MSGDIGLSAIYIKECMFLQNMYRWEDIFGSHFVKSRKCDSVNPNILISCLVVVAISFIITSEKIVCIKYLSIGMYLC